MRIREGRSEDLPRLVEIYNEYIEHTPITFDVEPYSLDARRAWFEMFEPRGPHRLFVLESDGRVDGYASSGVFRPKAAYARSVETSIYLHPDACGAGGGTALYSRLLATLEAEATVHRVLAGITLPNEASLALHRRFGFERVATFSEVGFKFGQYWDVAWFELAL